MSDLNDLYSGGGARAAKFESPGDVYEGTIVKLEQKQLPTYEDENILETWRKDGSPKLTWLLTLQTSDQDDDDDDGKRMVYCRSNAHYALKEALEEAGKPSMDEVVGAHMRVEFTELGEQKNPRFNPPKLFEMVFTAKAAGPVDGDDDQRAAEDDDIPF